MNVILDLDKTYLDKFQEMANQDNRSRKNFMETVLINYLNGNPPTMERHESKKQLQEKYPPKPTRDANEGFMEYQVRLQEWKQKYNQ